MRLAPVLVLVAFLVFTSVSFAGKALIRVYFDDTDHIRTVVSRFEDVAGWGGKRYADIVVPGDRVAQLKAIAPNHEILIPDVDEHMRQVGVLGVGGAYHTQEETYADMDSVATANPGICQLQSIGLSIEGRDIWALKISDNVSVNEDEPRVLYLGCHHAREVISVEIPLDLMFWLVGNYGSDSLATYLVDNREIWIVPLMNPDGREYVEHVGDWRKNRRDNGDGTYGVDLNRNWGYMWGYDNIGSSPDPGNEVYRGPAAFSEPETQVIRDLMLNYQFDTCISYHSHGRLILWAWGYTYDLCPDQDVFAALGDSMAFFNGYAPTAASGFYLANGISDDWMYGEQLIKDKVFSMTYEVGEEFYPPASEITTLCEENREASLLAAVYADNVRRVVPPGRPEILAMADDDDGMYAVTWVPDNSDTSNLSVAFALIERTGPGEITDDVEAGDIHWERDKFRLSTARVSSGVQSFYGGYTDNRDATLTSGIALDVAAGDTLYFDTWYYIETGWDYAYVEVSTDGGAHFYSIPGNITTTDNPNGNNLGHGITGDSGGWTQAVFSLDAFADSTVLVRFRYKTDSYVLREGIYVDDIFPVQTFDSSAVLSNTITDTSYTLTRPIGTYYYEVMAQDGDGQWGCLSNRESISVTGAGVEVVTGATETSGFGNPVYLGSSVRLLASGIPGAAVSVFDVHGRMIRTLSGRAQGGTVWNLRGEDGRLVAPGIYFVRYDPGLGIASKKLVVLK